MPYEAGGRRHTAVATKACKHGQIVTEDNIVGEAFKVEQLGWRVAPGDAQDIDSSEEFEIQIGGEHETAAVNGLASAVIGTKVWITKADNVLSTSTGAGKLPVGVVVDVDASRTPAALRINARSWQAFLPGA